MNEIEQWQYDINNGWPVLIVINYAKKHLIELQNLPKTYKVTQAITRVTKFINTN